MPTSHSVVAGARTAFIRLTHLLPKSTVCHAKDMNRSTPPSASRGSEDSSVLRKINPTLYQQLSQMNYPLPVDVESHMQTLITLGESMVRLSSRQAPEQEDDSESGGVTPKTFPEIVSADFSVPAQSVM